MITRRQIPSASHLSPTQLDEWFGNLQVGAGPDTPSAQELQSSVSWRVTRPLRALRARERVSAARRGQLRLVRHDDADVGLRKARTALEQRVRHIAPLLLPGNSPAELAALSVEDLIIMLCSAVHERNRFDEYWLLVIAISACFPDQAMIFALERDLRGANARDVTPRILHHCGVWTSRHRSQYRRVKVVTTQPVAYVDFSARFGFNSGIQRVTRETLSRWQAHGPFTLAALTEDGTGLRELLPDETQRVLNWTKDNDSDRDKQDFEIDDSEAVLVVPWQTTFFVPEAPVSGGTITLAAMARFSTNRTVAIGYDTIPVSSGHFVHRALTSLFVSYLSMIKYFDEVVAISDATNAEFTGFSEALATQGLRGPEVKTVLLPLEHIAADIAFVPPAPDDEPTVLSVGSNEPRKNQLAVVYAAEILWREGLRFSLVLLGGRGDKNFTDVPDAVSALHAQGRSITLRRDVDEAELADAYRRARFSVFISRQEGYGLPVSESLAVGTPALTTSYGSTAEIASGGGCVTVDPNDDDAIVDAMRSMVVDDELIGRLHHEIDERSDTTWGEYAASLWNIVTNEDRA